MERKNLHAENQPKGSARNLSDTLDRKNERVEPGEREWSEDSEKDPDVVAPLPLETPGAPGGTSGTGGTHHDSDR